MSQSRLDWLVTDFTERVANVAHAIVVSADGLTLAKSAAFSEVRAEQLAAITSGLSSLIDGTARIFDAGPPIQALVEMARGLMLVKTVSGTAILVALAAPECDIDLVAYEMTLLVEEVGEVLTPPTRVLIRKILPVFLQWPNSERTAVRVCRRRLPCSGPVAAVTSAAVT